MSLFKKKIIGGVIITLSVTISLLFAFASDTKEQEPSYKWLSISGKWDIDTEKGLLTESKKSTSDWGYNPLINRNSLVTTDDYRDYTVIDTTFTLSDPIEDKKVESLFFWGVTDYRSIYAVQFQGDSTGIKSIRLIKSKVKDLTAPLRVKWNFTLEEIAKIEQQIPFNTKTRLRVFIYNEQNYSIFLNRKRIFRGKFSPGSVFGKVGMSNKNVKITVSKYRLRDRFNKTIFEDKFTEDSIRRYRVRLNRKNQ